jgi:hypothetical protein
MDRILVEDLRGALLVGASPGIGDEADGLLTSFLAVLAGV